MRTGASGINTHITGEVTSLARCMKLVRAGDLLTTKITDHDEDITIASEVVLASSTLEIAPTTGGAVAAQGILSFTTNALNAETVTIDGRVYTFVTGALDATGKVKVGVDSGTSLTNLQQAINAGTGAGVLYASGTTAHSTVTADVISITNPLSAEATLVGATGITAHFSNFTTNSGAWFDGVQTAQTVLQPQTTDQTGAMWAGATFNIPRSIVYIKIYPTWMWHIHNNKHFAVSWVYGVDGHIPANQAQATMNLDGFNV